ncbi:MAG: hypothetical protein R3264_14765, partial [Anaerolineae bacterium]|nr:hypothetical protein [Anaerolineae bacterium]
AWQEDPTYIAYGPNQITLAFINGNNSGILEVGWQPATEADCIAHRPAAVCQVKANHRLYTVTFTDISTLDLLDNGSSS